MWVPCKTNQRIVQQAEMPCKIMGFAEYKTFWVGLKAALVRAEGTCSCKKGVNFGNVLAPALRLSALEYFSTLGSKFGGFMGGRIARMVCMAPSGWIFIHFSISY